MTPEEIAAKCVPWPFVGVDERKLIVAAVVKAIREAEQRGAERAAEHVEYCAESADRNGVAINGDGLRHVAAAIRARKELPGVAMYYEHLIDTPNLVLAFSSYGDDFGLYYPPLEFAKTLHDTAHVLFSDDERCWYQNGVGGIGGRIAVVRYIRRICRGSNYKKVTAIGLSMGGFAALMFGGYTWMIDHVIAMAPQTCIDPYFLETFGDNRWKYPASPEEDEPTKAEDYTPEITICLPTHGEHLHLDEIHAARVPKAKYLRVEAEHKDIARVMVKDGTLRKLIGLPALFPTTPAPCTPSAGSDSLPEQSP